MAGWQYANAPRGNKGYFVNLPNRTAPTQGRSTAALVDQDNHWMYMWIHDIQMSFQNGGGAAQVHRKAVWYARNFTAPRIVVSGQTANQEQYQTLAEFIHRSQQMSLRWKDPANEGGTSVVRLVIPKSGTRSVDGTTVKNWERRPHYYGGHIVSIDRSHDRYVNAPEFQFEFIIQYAWAGLFHVEDDPDYMKQRLAPWLDVVKRRGKNAFVTDPDIIDPIGIDAGINFLQGLNG